MDSWAIIPTMFCVTDAFQYFTYSPLNNLIFAITTVPLTLNVFAVNRNILILQRDIVMSPGLCMTESY